MTEQDSSAGADLRPDQQEEPEATDTQEAPDAPEVAEGPDGQRAPDTQDAPDTQEAPGAPDVPARRPRGVAVAALVGLVVARGAVHAWQGAHLVLDDWSIIYYGQQDFWGALSPEFRTSRPGAWLALTVVYGVVGAHPGVLLAIVTALNAVVAVLVYLVAARYLPTWWAAAVPAVWVLMASHASLTVWAATVPTLVALCFLAGGTLALQRHHWVVATVCLCAGALSYELVLPAAGVAALVVGDHRRVGWSRRAVMVVALGLVGAWTATHSIYPVSPEVPSLTDFWDSLVGRGVLGVGDPADWLRLTLEWLTLGGAVAALVLFARGDRAPDRGPWLVMVGTALVVLGATGWVNLPNLVLPLAQSDRVNALSALGAAAIWVGVARALWVRRLRVVTIAVAAVLCAIAAVGQVAAMASWSAAGGDVAALFRYLDDTFQYADSRDFVVGLNRTPITHDGVFALGGEGFADPAARVSLGDGAGSVVLAGDPQELVGTGRGTLVDWTDVLGGDPFPIELLYPEQPIGEAHAVPDQQTIVFAGWAYDPSAPTDPIQVQLRANSQTVTVTADQPSPELADSHPEAGTQHGFVATVEVENGLQIACVVAINVGAGGDVPLPTRGGAGPDTAYCTGVPD